MDQPHPMPFFQYSFETHLGAYIRYIFIISVRWGSSLSTLYWALLYQAR
jgi:hypothetical protein